MTCLAYNGDALTHRREVCFFTPKNKRAKKQIALSAMLSLGLFLPYNLKKNMKSKSAMLAMLGLGMAMMPPDQQRALMDYDEKPRAKLPPIEKPPSGTKEYFFNQLGEFSTERMLKTECVFKCYAINDKNAKRKFAKWKKQT